MATITLEELIKHYKIPQGFLDEKFSDEHTKDFALLIDSWELLASHLGLSKQQVDTIKVDSHRHEVRRENVLTKWKETYAYRATYRRLLEVLLNIDRKDLACNVCELMTAKKQGPQPSSSPKKKLPKECENGSTSTHQSVLSTQSHESSKSHRFSDMANHFTTISEAEDAFLDIVVEVEEYFDENVPLVKLQRYSCHLPVSLKGQFGRLFKEEASKQIWNTNAVGELFTILSYFWDYLHPDLLHYLVKRFGNEQTIDLVSKYVDELSEFRRNVKIPDYIGERRINLVADDYVPIIAIFGDKWYDKTLADLEEVRCDFSQKFSFLRLLPKMNGLKYNSIAIIFSVPKSVQFNNDELCEFFRSYNVLKLTVGDECIYDDGTPSQITSSEKQDDGAVPVDMLAECEFEPEVVAKPGKERRDSDSDHSQGIGGDGKAGYQELSQPGGFTCEFIEKPPKGIQFECPVCLQTLCEPYQVICCGYSFCKVCIEQLKTDNKHCPTCNEENVTFYPNKGLQRSLYDYEVYCTHKDKGCRWTGELRQLENHLNENSQQKNELEGCLYACVDCKFKSVGCEVRPAREDVPTHLNDYSKIHLKLVSIAFAEAQNQNAKLSQQVVEEKEQNVKEKEQNVKLTQQVLREKEQNAKLSEQFRREKEDDERKIASLSEILHITAGEYNWLRYCISYPTYPPESSQAESIEEMSTPVPDVISRTLPATFLLTNFDELKRHDDCWFSPPFYTHHHGYKMCLRVNPNGHPNEADAHGTHVSLYIRFKKGEFDDDLKWPFRGMFVVTLLDQEEKNQYGYSSNIRFGDDLPNNVAGRVILGNTAYLGNGLHKYIPHHELQPKYLKNNCLLFRITTIHINH